MNGVLALESRFDLAYNAAHGLCLAALRWYGYRSNHRYIVFQVLPHTLGLGPTVWRVLAKCHDIRNLGEYEGDLNADERLVTDLISAAIVVSAKVMALPAIKSRGSRCPRKVEADSVSAILNRVPAQSSALKTAIQTTRLSFRDFTSTTMTPCTRTRATPK